MDQQQGARCNGICNIATATRHSLLLAAVFAFSAHMSPVNAAEPAHGLSKYGELKYPADFAHFEYADPAAKKGGSITRASLGTFDNTNPFILKGR